MMRALTVLLMPWLLHAAPEGKIALTVEGVRSDKGHVLVALFDQPAGFPDQPRQSLRVWRWSAKPKALSHGFSGLPVHGYALAVVHDENDNHKLDMNAEGVPVEGYAFSNPSPSASGPSNFRQAEFKLKLPVTEVKLKMIYSARNK